MRLPITLAALLVLTACGRNDEAADELARLDNELQAANGADPARDPATRQALGDQIMVDPQLVQQSNANAIRPPSRPDAGATAPVDIAASRDGAPAPVGLTQAPAAKRDCPECKQRGSALTLGAIAGRGPNPVSADCANRMAYSAAWANRLPAAAPLYPDARVIEAAGVDEPGCAFRAVTFRSSAPLQQLANWYYTKGRQAGFSAEHRADAGVHVVGGTRGELAFLVYLRPRGNDGTDVDVVTNGG